MLEMSKDVKKRILIVDDDPEVLEILRSYLEPDYQVGTLDNGDFAVEYIKSNETDLILMDVVMPDKDGFEVVKDIRNSEEGKDIPVLFVTGKSDRNIVLDSINLGVDGYLIKPVAKDRLRRKVLDVLNRQDVMKNKKTLLTVDDDVTYLKIINNSLKDNFNVVMINSTKLALNYLDTHKPDIVLIDYNLVPYEGHGVMDYIRHVLNDKDMPIIMMAGINDKKAIVENITDRPDRFLIKPISKLDLLKAIISALCDHGKSLN